MAELNAILAKIEEASREKIQAMQSRAEWESQKMDETAQAEREAWKAAEFARLQRASDALYMQESAALEQDFKKKLLRDRRALVNDALSALPKRLSQCSKEEFFALLRAALSEIEPGDSLSIQFGANAPVDSWSGWAAEYVGGQLQGVNLDVVGETIPNETGFVLGSRAISYRLMGSEIIGQLMEEKGGDIEKRLFADGAGEQA